VTTEAAAGEAAPTDRAAPTQRAATARAARPRRAPGDLSFRLDPALVESFAAEEPAWLADDRRAALARYEELPAESNPLYTGYLDLRAAELADARPYETPEGRPPGPASATPSPDLAGLASFVEDRVEAVMLDETARAAGVVLEPIGAHVGRDPSTARRLLTDPASLPVDDRFAQLTRAGWNQGVVVRVPEGLRLERPIVIRWAVGAPGRVLLTRTVVELGDQAAATIVEEIIPSGPEIGCADGEPVPQALFTSTMEARLGSGATLGVAAVQETGPGQVVLSHRTGRVGEAATLRWALAQLGGRIVRGRVDTHLDGDRSAVEQVEIVFGTGDQLFDLTTYTRHVGRDTTGSVLSKGALRDRGRMFLKGMAIIERSAVGTDSFLGEYGMNLSKQTRSVAIPSLEIDQPDCRRAAHSSSVGPIDEDQVFYLESRGIPDDEARKSIVLGYLEPVVARVPLPDVQDRLRSLLESKWVSGAGPA
jgi:Fe-S cluster assembly scaffold protein SufB